MTTVFRQILCPMDFDENSPLALEYAAKLAQPPETRLYLLHVVPDETTVLNKDVYRPREGPDQDRHWAQQVATEKLQEMARERLSEGTQYEILTRVGNPAQAVLDTAQTIGADLIVMATHGRRGLAHFMLGSVAERVIREALCPVLTVRRR